MSDAEAEQPGKAEWWDLNALWFWGYTLIVSCIVVYQTVVYFGIQPGASEPATQIPWLLIVGWIVLLVMIFESLRQCCIEVVLTEDGQLQVTRYYLHGAVQEHLTKDSVTPAEIAITKGGENGPAYEARIRLPRNKHVVIGVFGDRAECAEACARFNEALARVR